MKRYGPGLGLMGAIQRKITAEVSFRRKAVFLLSTLLVSTALSFLLSGYSRIRIPDYAVSDIANTDILVPSDILILDDQATKARKAAARDSVPPVYRYNRSGQAGLASRISEVFSVCREALQPTISKGGEISYRGLPPTVGASIKSEMERVGAPIEDVLLDYFVRQGFKQELEDQLISALGQIPSSWLMEEDHSPIGALENIEVVIDSGSEKQFVPVRQVLDLDHARRQLRESMNRILKAPSRIRQMTSEWLEGMITANLHFDPQTTEARKAQAAEAADPVLRQLKQGKIIVRQGDEISGDQLTQINAVRNLTSSLRTVPRFVGTNVLLFFLLMIMGRLVREVSVRQWSQARLVTLCFGTLVVNIGLLRIFWFVSESLSRNFVASPFNDSRLFFSALPFAFGAMLITVLAGDRVAQLFLVFYCPLALQVTGAGFQDFLYIVAVNLAGILVVHSVRQRVAIVGAGFKLSAAATGLFIAVQFARQTPPNTATGAFGAALAFLSGPITASLLTFALPLCEHMFMVTTEIRLSELGNLNLPLLRDLVVRAPGTYNHSIAVGTLAQGAANAIGLNPLFLRVASLYHDIGKLLQPRYFIENKGEGANPHDDLDPKESVQIILQHITEGIRLGREAGLPPAVIDVIPQHHGTKILSFFYDKAKLKAGSDGSEIREEDYRYPGPKPQTKEAAVVMLADAIEAAARTLSDHSQERLLSVIQKITATTMQDGQLAECDLTLSEIERISFSFLETLASFYHSRIEYPSFDFGAKPVSRAGS